MIIRHSRDITTKVYFRETSAPGWLCRNKYDASLAKLVRRLPWRNRNNPWTFLRSSHQMSLSVKTREDVNNTSGTKRIKVLETSRLKACTMKRAGGIPSPSHRLHVIHLSRREDVTNTSKTKVHKVPRLDAYMNSVGGSIAFQNHKHKYRKKSAT